LSMRLLVVRSECSYRYHQSLKGLNSFEVSCLKLKLKNVTEATVGDSGLGLLTQTFVSGKRQS
jgi:hypothetical protein